MAANVVIVFLTLVAVWAAFAPTVRQMLSIWNTYSYQHCYLVPVVCGWLAWRDRARFDGSGGPWMPAAGLLLGAGLMWAIGRIIGASFLQQIALVSTVPGTIALLLGWRALWSVAYPVGMLFLMVPFGESLVPALVDWTADATVAAVGASGIAIFRVGNDFELPTGRWSVVEACSGLRYILASLLLATIFAKLNYREPVRRALFILSAVVLAIVANWLRAYAVVMIGHLSNMKYGTGDDHLWFGWILYGVVMSALFWVGGRWATERDDALQNRRTRDLLMSHATPTPGRSAMVALVGFAAAAIWVPASSALIAVEGPPSGFALPDGLVRPPPAMDRIRTFTPDFSEGVQRIDGVLIADPDVHVQAIRYARQETTGEMVTARNRVVGAEEEQTLWRVVEERSLRLGDTKPSSMGPEVNEYVVSGFDQKILVWEWFVIGEHATPSRVKARLLTAARILSMRGDEGAVVHVWAPLDGSVERARQRLSAAVTGFAVLSPSGGPR